MSAAGAAGAASDARAFDSAWLALREPFDLAARGMAWRSVDLAARAREWRGDASTLNVVDLACGSGANLRALAPRLPGAQQWTLVDHDTALLAALPAALRAWAEGAGFDVRAHGSGLHIAGDGWHAEVAPMQHDLAAELPRVPLARAQLVTASALLDLVSGAWFDALLAQGTAVPAWLFALSVDGRTTWAPADTDDAAVDTLFAAHQLRDKGFGPALGPAAPAHAAQRLQASGHAVQAMPSDWHIAAAAGPRDAALLRALIESMAKAAGEQAPSMRGRIAAWQQRRLAALAATRLTIGHIDLLATRSPVPR